MKSPTRNPTLDVISRSSPLRHPLMMAHMATTMMKMSVILLSVSVGVQYLVGSIN